jgi:copper(I)-binding protein
MKFFVALMAGCLALISPAQAHSYKQKRIEIVHPWCRPTAKGDTVQVYALVRNLSRTTDRLVAVRTSFGTARIADAPARARGKLTIAAKGELALKKNGPYIEVAGAAKQLGEYDGFPLTLVFEKAGAIEIEVTVEEAGSH